MKRRIILLVFAALMCRANAQQISKPALGASVEVNSFEYRADSVELSLLFDLSELDLDSKESVVYTPVISDKRNAEALPTIVVRGRSGAKSYERAMIVGGVREKEMYGKLYQTPYKVVEYYGAGKDEPKLEYRYVIPYEMWMAYSSIDVWSEVYSCCDSADGGMIPLDNNGLNINIPTLAPYQFVPRVELIKPEKVAIKRRDVNYSSNVKFGVNSSYIDHSLADNKSEFMAIDAMMKDVIADDDCTITAVHVIGYASPEGSYRSNQVLSERRATAIEEYLVGKYSVSRDLYNVEFGGENWTDLIPLVEGCKELTDRGDIVGIISGVSVEDGRERQLMGLKGGDSYRYMLRNLFPALRKVDIDVEFNVDAYDLARIKEVIKTKPRNLSLEEMYRLSEGYDVNSEEFLDIFLTAVEVFPDDLVALHNALVSELRVGDVDAASPYAEKLDESRDSLTDEMVNAVGAYFSLIGDYERAEEYLQRAVDCGDVNAPFNMEQSVIKKGVDHEIEQNNELRRKIYGDSTPVE